MQTTFIQANGLRFEVLRGMFPNSPKQPVARSGLHC